MLTRNVFRDLRLCYRLLNTRCPLSQSQRESTVDDNQNNSQKKKEQGASTSVVRSDYLHKAALAKTQQKADFENAIGTFIQKNVERRGHVEFIYALLRRMKEMGLHRDLDAYKKLLEVFPKGKFVPDTLLQTYYMHYPKQQQCCIDVLDEMEYYRVWPDKEIYDIVRNTFGEWTHAMRKMKRMMYWLPRFKYLDPHPTPLFHELPSTTLDHARVVLQRICPDPATAVSTFYTDAIDEADERTWIVSAQCHQQRRLLNTYARPAPLQVEGPFRVWLHGRSLSYFVLSATTDAERSFNSDDDPTYRYTSMESWANSRQSMYTSEFSQQREQDLITTPTLHEQPDGTILAVAITETGAVESLDLWLQFLQQENPRLRELSIIFKLERAIHDSLVPLDSTVT